MQKHSEKPKPAGPYYVLKTTQYSTEQFW